MIWPNPLLKTRLTSALDQVPCGCFQMSFAYLQQWISHSNHVIAWRIIASLTCLSFLILTSKVAIHFWRQLQRSVRNITFKQPTRYWNDLCCYFEHHGTAFTSFTLIASDNCSTVSNGNFAHNSSSSLFIIFSVWNTSKKMEAIIFGNIFLWAPWT